MKVIFLDIDGPLIPATMFLQNRMCSFDREFSPLCVLALKEIVDRTRAKIVFNTTHSNSFPDKEDIEICLEKAGIDKSHFHSDMKTKYPQLPRDIAVKEWLARNDVEDWIALDDCRFTDKSNLIWVEPDAGLHVGHVNQAIERLGGKPMLILM